MRLQKYMAASQVASRRKSEAIIAEGRVAVNGQIVTEQGLRVDPERDRVTVDGRLIRPVRKKSYVLFNKPLGYLTTVDDPQGRPTIYELLPQYQGKLIPVGRLDMDSQGLLLLTNDGDFAYRMTHPKFGIRKTYRVRVDGLIDDAALKYLREGVELEDGRTSPAKVKLLKRSRATSLLEIVLREGKNRQVRRMCEAVGHPVLSLTRTRIENLSLSHTDTGSHRDLEEDELRPLFARLNLPQPSTKGKPRRKGS